MRKFLKKVTISGAGDSTDPHELVALAEEFPFVEFGIQLARGSKKGWSRFPSDQWLAKLVGELTRIAKVIGEATVWIDAEGQLRTPCDRALDLGKVRELLMVARPWVD